ncbi:hypothetical protein [Sporosarcina sp. NPDC096371]|uniref:hypothetical protein n=1 Tax=Sporosarcina sp. NPDC096371 TaxID=3364530 RepID=UPI0037FC503B
MGVKPGLKFDGTQLAAGAIKVGKIYDWYYDTASGGRFFLIAKASGTAVVGDVLAGKPFINDDGEFVGAMANRGNVGAYELTSQNQTYTIPAGYHNGSGTVRAIYPSRRVASGSVSIGASEIMEIINLAFGPTRVNIWSNNVTTGFGRAWAVFNFETKRLGAPKIFQTHVGYNVSRDSIASQFKSAVDQPSNVDIAIILNPS